MATMTPPNPQTQIQLTDTQQAYQAFVDACQALSPIATDTNDYPTRIANLAMNSTAGSLFSNAVSDWVTHFQQLWTLLGQITAQIEAQYQAMAGVNDQNTDLAKNMSEPEFMPAQRVLATPATPAT